MHDALRALGRLPVGEMNRTEAGYAAHLEAERQAGYVLAYTFEAMKLRLANNTFYTPDFLVMAADRTLELHEVKGFWADDARVKIKVAAHQHPYLKFIAVRAKPKRDGGGWTIEEF